MLTANDPKKKVIYFLGGIFVFVFLIAQLIELPSIVLIVTFTVLYALIIFLYKTTTIEIYQSQLVYKNPLFSRFGISIGSMPIHSVRRINLSNQKGKHGRLTWYIDFESDHQTLKMPLKPRDAAFKVINKVTSINTSVILPPEIEMLRNPQASPELHLQPKRKSNKLVTTFIVLAVIAWIAISIISGSDNLQEFFYFTFQ